MCSITVIIPCKNEAHNLPLTLKHIFDEVRHGYISEIILVDNESTDNSVEIASYFGVKILTCSGNISQVRNFGAHNATNEILGFIDADVEIVDGWSLEVVKFFKNNQYADNLIIGHTYGVRDSCSWIERIWHKYLQARRKTKYINGGNLALTKACFKRIGGFDPELITGEDVDFCQRALDIGINIINNVELKTIHHGYPQDLVSFYKRERWHGLGMSKYLLSPHKSKPLLLAYLVLCMPIILPIIYFFFGKKTFVILQLPAFIFCMRRLNDSRLHDKLRLLVLLNVYSIARAHALYEILSKN